MKRKYFTDMFLLCMTVTCVLLGSSAGLEDENKCFGSSYRLPFEYTPPLFRETMFFTLRNGGPRRIVIESGQIKDPRIKIVGVSAELTDLRESDAGTFSVTFSDNGKQFEVISLTILDCSDRVDRRYGSMYEIKIPTLAEYLEFTPLDSVDETKVLWNRTDPQTHKGGRGQLRRKAYEIHKVTQADNGHYTLRKKDNTMLGREKLTVEVNYRRYDVKVGDFLIIPSQLDIPWTVTFIPADQSGPKTVMEDGKEYTRAPWPIRPFKERLWIRDLNIEISPVEPEDSGVLEYRDPQGNLAYSMQVEVMHEPVSVYVYVGIGVGIVAAVIFCCCCVRKCCCKKSSSKRAATPAPAVHYHDGNQENQPAGPSHSAASPPTYTEAILHPSVSRGPATNFLGPSAPAPAPASTPSSAPAPAPSLASDYLYSDSGPKFELKGRMFASAPPLGSDSNFSDVYNSDKLNFL